MTISPKRAALLAASALTLMLAGASSASAQYQGSSYNQTPTEEIIVTAPEQYRQERGSATGAPIRDVAMQEEVRFDDLDLTTNWGARTLQRRVATSARALCQRLDNRFPATEAGSPDCYRTAMRDAMAQADEAIAQARGE